MEEILSALLADPIFRTFVEGVAVKVIVDLFCRRSIDPEFEKKSDEIFDQYAKAQTDEEKQNGLSAIQDLMSTPSPR